MIGNKRVGVSLLGINLKINNIKIQYTQEELIQLGLGLGDGTFDSKEILKFINNHKI